MTLRIKIHGFLSGWHDFNSLSSIYHCTGVRENQRGDLGFKNKGVADYASRAARC